MCKILRKTNLKNKTRQRQKTKQANKLTKRKQVQVKTKLKTKKNKTNEQSKMRKREREKMLHPQPTLFFLNLFSHLVDLFPYQKATFTLLKLSYLLCAIFL